MMRGSCVVNPHSVRSSVVFLFLCFFNLTPIFSQEYRFRIDFTDKNNSLYSISYPDQFLTQRAINRRIQQGIPIVEDDLPVNQSYIDSILSIGNIRLLNRSKWFNSITVSTADSSLINVINAFTFVEKTTGYKKTSSDFSQKKLQTEPDSDFHRESTGVHLSSGQMPAVTGPGIDYGAGFNQVNMIHIDSIHNLGFRGENMLIAVLDAGFISADTLKAFKHLFDDNRIKAAWNFVKDNDSVFTGATHGTFVLSIMASMLPGLLVGTAPEAEYMLLVSEDISSETIVEEFNWVAAAEFADSAGADIINSSLGYTTFDNAMHNHTYAEMDGKTAPASIGADVASGKGILVVNSAGNSGGGSWNFIGVPADGDRVLAVGAVNADRKYASFSSNGPSYDGRVKPDIAAQGQATVFASLTDSIASGSGTSFSSPVIAGAAACLWQSVPGKTNIEILHAIRKSATQYYNPDTLLGYGIPNFITAYQILSGKNILEFTTDTLFVSPNPFSENLQVIFYSKINQLVTMEIVNTSGKLILSTGKKAVEGLNEYPVYGYEIKSPGIFTLKLITGKEIFTEKIIKL